MKMNESGKICPHCSRDVGIRLLFPDGALKCPHCGTKLRYNPLGIGFFSLLLFVFFGIASLAIYLTTDIWIHQISVRAAMLLWGVIGCCMWIPFGFFASYHLRKKSKLELKNS